jgi:hypothetical protein
MANLFVKIKRKRLKHEAFCLMPAVAWGCQLCCTAAACPTHLPCVAKIHAINDPPALGCHVIATDNTESWAKVHFCLAFGMTTKGWY